MFVQTEEKHLKPSYHRSRTGLNHLAFNLPSRDEVDILTAKLTKRGVRVLYQDRHPHAGGAAHYAVYFEDPDRLKVECVAIT
ncbi:VOC family protein [Veronia pacifica]|uniref:VOC family protein n=1 Tax=Veronia pacifica TaxID=1080227 RepID=UPI001C2FA036|nr:VOC family protein [Veronia pacifica]